MIDALASSAHYVDHLAGVLNALPEEARGDVLTKSAEVTSRARAAGLSVRIPDQSADPVLVASYNDLITASTLRDRVAIMEHGAGQSYGGRALAARRGSYAGGTHRDGASLFLHPGPHPASRDRAAYPAARVEVVGAPHLDTLPGRHGDSGRVVAVSFHFNAPVAPETRTAWPWIFEAIVKLAEQYEVIGHAHPRMWDRAEKVYQRVGIEPVKEFSEVCRRADLYVCDNSSTLFAFAATGRPVVVLNPPWYDRRVNHGLRFWEASEVGVNCNDPDALADCIDEAFRDTAEQKAKREAALDMVYAYRSGASRRAADVLMDWAA